MEYDLKAKSQTIALMLVSVVMTSGAAFYAVDNAINDALTPDPFRLVAQEVSNPLVTPFTNLPDNVIQSPGQTAFTLVLPSNIPQDNKSESEVCWCSINQNQIADNEKINFDKPQTPRAVSKLIVRIPAQP